MMSNNDDVDGRKSLHKGIPQLPPPVVENHKEEKERDNDSKLISIPDMPTTTNESESSFYTNFHQGCTYLYDQQQQQSEFTTATVQSAEVSSSAVVSSPPPSSVLPEFLSHVTVSFIDPTTSSIMMSSSGSSSNGTTNTSTTSTGGSKTISSVGYSAAVRKAKMNQSIQLYEKFQRIFTTQYNATLTSVPYQLFRNTMICGEIDLLPIRTVVTRGHGGFIVTEDSRTTSSGGNNTIMNQKVHGDYSWEQPYCHVYLAACESLEHYRTKVKPSIQVFISQLEAAIKASASSSSSSVLSRFRRSRSNDTTTTTTTTTTPVGSSTSTANDTSMDESVNGGGGLDISMTGKSKKTKRIPPAPRYVIIYVPTGNNTNNNNTDSTDISISPFKGTKPMTSTGTVSTTTTTSGTSTSALGASVASRFAAARQRMTSAVVVATTAAGRTTSGTSGGDDTTTNTGSTSTNHNNNESNTVTDDETLLGQSPPSSLSTTTNIPPPAIQQLNRMEREIARRFAMDFPTGNVCTLSTLFDAQPPPSPPPVVDDPHKNNSFRTEVPVPAPSENSNNIVQQLEWQAVLKAMGNAIMANFHDRCQRYDDEIRLIDNKRRGLQHQDSNPIASTTPTKQSAPGVSNTDTTQLDESTNGTLSVSDDFHLCHFFLVKENLAFAYEQMRLPSEAMLQYEELRAFLPDPMDNITNITENDNDREKRADRNELSDLALRGNILDFRSLLKVHGDTATIQSVADEYLFAREIALLFQMKKSVQIMQRCYSYVQSTFDRKKRQIDEMDISKESRQQLIDLYQWAYCFCWYIKSGSDCLFTDGSFVKSPDYIACARCVCDVLEFARQCFQTIGDLALSESGVLIRPYNQGMTTSMKGQWAPWQEPTRSEIPSQPVICFASPNEFLQNALTSKTLYAERYCDILDTVATCHEYCGRRRYAARLRIERVDILDTKEDKVNAAKELFSILNLYRSDQWYACHFALILRLAGFQRVTASPTEYLDTLIRCFYRGVHDFAPPKALEALHTDLLSVVQVPSIKDARYAAASIFGPSFGLEGISSTALPGSDRSLVKKLYSLGDTIHVNLALNSFLYKDIGVDSISINLVHFPKYVAAMEDSLLITEADIHHVITLSNVKVAPGANELVGEWRPKSSGQFIIASLCVSWSGVNFTYTAKEIRRPTIRIDVVPCAPSQTIEVMPKCLLVGQEQPVQIELNANKDCVIGGKLVLDGPNNVSFRHHDSEIGTNEWVSSLEIAIQPCEPFHKVLYEAHVKVATAADFEISLKPVHANLSTRYKYALDAANELESETMQASLNATVDILTNPAFTIQTCGLISYSSNKVLVNAVLKCNSVEDLTIKSWSIDLPSYYVLSNGGDMNDSLANTTVSCGDRLSLTFDCRNCSTTQGVSVSNSVLHLNFANEMGSKLQESIKLKLKSPLDAALKVLDAKPVAVKVVSSVKELMVGLPVELIYTIDLSETVFTLGKVTYRIATDHADWILNGKHIGVVSTLSDKTSVVTITAISTRPGQIHEYPSLSLISLCDTGSETIPTLLESTEPFTSLSPPDHTSIAFYIGNN